MLVALVAALACATPASAARPLETSFLDPTIFENPVKQGKAFSRARAAGATKVRLALHWVSVAPTSPNPSTYNWSWFDAQVRAARARGLDPIAVITNAPKWATNNGAGGDDHATRPSPVALASFAQAAATRYNGDFQPSGASADLPAVRHWQIWNEPNRPATLKPQYENDRIESAELYRELLGHAGRAIRLVNPDNQIVAGGLAPRAKRGMPAPLPFMRQLMCVSKTFRRTCDLRATPLELDVWSHHPYTPGGPTHRAQSGGDVLISGLPKMRKLLMAAVRLGHVDFLGPVKFWATEFGWDTRPPDPEAVPMWLHARWTSEALYRMWNAGISQVTWWRIQDDPLRGPNGTPYQSGFYTAGGNKKRSFTAFRFPTVAFRSSGGIKVWGRTPAGRRGTVGIFVRTGGAWRRIGKLGTSPHGIFRRTYRVPYRGTAVQARWNGQRSLGFSLTRVRNRSVNPMGCGGNVSCR